MTKKIEKEVIMGGITILLLLMLSTVFSAYYVVDESERGVLLRNGKLVEVVEPGLGMKIPFIESIKFISIQSFATTYSKVEAYSADQQAANLSASVNWRVDPSKIDIIYRSYKDEEGLRTRSIDRIIQSQIENTFGQYTAVRVVQERAKFSSDVKNGVTNALEEYPIIIESVQIENIDFNNDYDQAINKRMEAEVQVRTREQELQREKIQAQIVETKAQGEANSLILKAKASAEATKLAGEAEAYAIKVKADSLRQNKDLVELIKAERWDGKLPATMLPNSGVPFINVK